MTNLGKPPGNPLENSQNFAENLGFFWRLLSCHDWQFGIGKSGPVPFARTMS